ncbi:GNAT family N-acetyltransferase [Nostocoides sp. F2B08]|uniref:GNAT family N-acetyltransferase n=1 Tax=Nostocoides sp. F2B08 TaxID=2653936 RepID=UPI0012633C47|nr:GNAT family N-acetyltransferase [Tetrasphaera sp. F2B08]KAB7746268.1 GNAT family N-acetyltransferase [Tetrasphaera sp. F2B08]
MPGDSTTSSTPGTRVAVRFLLPEPDPRTGARLTDVTGTLVENGPDRVVVDSARGRVVVPRERVVASRVIPPRPVRRGAPHRSLSLEDLERVMNGAWPPVEREMLGQWVLRAGHGFTARANSALAIGFPDAPLGQALLEVARWYEQRSLGPLLTVPVPEVGALPEDPVVQAALAAGWRTGEPVLVQSAAAREVLQVPAPDVRVEVGARMSDEWYAALAAYRAAPRAAAQAVLHGSPDQRFALVRDAEGAVVAIGRLGVSDGWGGLGAMWVAPGHRRRGLGRALVRTMATEAAGLGCVSLHLQVEVANSAARTLYAEVGFTTHHAYAYLAPGVVPGPVSRAC